MTLKYQNEELKNKASSPEDFDAELKIKKQRGDDVKYEKIIEDEKPTHKFPKRFYHEGRNGLTYPKRHHTECCGTSCPSKTSGYCLYQKMFEYCSARRRELDQISFARDDRRCRHFCHKCCLTKRLAFEPLCREEDYENIWRVLREISEHPEIKKLELEIDFLSSSSVAYNLASLLPISPLDKQLILESSSNKTRLESLQEILKKLGG